MVQLSNWLPDVFTQAAGMEVAKLSFLGPFFALSVFAEDNVSSCHLNDICMMFLDHVLN